MAEMEVENIEKEVEIAVERLEIGGEENRNRWLEGWIVACT